MYSHENIFAEIQQLKNSPVTLDTAVGLAAMLYIDTHLDEAMDRHSGDGRDESDTALTQAQAKSWVENMENADGTTGPHWTMEETEAVRKKHGLTIAPMAFWVTMNMMYSDYCKAAEKMGVNSADFYICMTKAFLEDKDAQPEKLARYYEYIAEH